MMFMKVLFPEPDAPMMATKSPGRRSIETPLSAATGTSPLRQIFSIRSARKSGAGVCGKRTSAAELKGATVPPVARGGRIGQHHLISFGKTRDHLGALPVGNANEQGDADRLRSLQAVGDDLADPR